MVLEYVSSTVWLYNSNHNLSIKKYFTQNNDKLHKQFQMPIPGKCSNFLHSLFVIIIILFILFYFFNIFVIILFITNYEDSHSER
jgi:hypothetical protein